MTEEQIKPCPFCGIIPSVKVRKYGSGTPDEAYIYHNALLCPVEIKTRIYNKPEHAINQWNRRSYIEVKP